MTLRELGTYALEMFRPPRLQTVSEWADENRILVSESSSRTGPWRTDAAPYQKEIMDAFTQPGIWKIVVKASSQTGKTEQALNMMGRAMALEPGPMLFVQPTDALAEDFSKRRIAPMIEACKILKKLVYAAKGRDSNNTITMKTFPGGSIALTGANSPSELASRPIRYLFMDEVDRFPASAGTEGRPTELAERRTETFRHNRKVVITSSPGIKGKSEVEKQFLEGTQEEFHTQCPHCGVWSFIRFDNIIFEKQKLEEQQSWQVWNVRWKCPHCGGESREHDTKRCAGKWIARNPEAVKNGVRSFWLNAFMSPWSDWKDICLKFLQAKDDPEALKVFKNTILAELWEVQDNSGDPERLYARREHYDAEVPEGVLVMTMGIDTQDNRLEYEVVGWNRYEESWGIERGIIPGRADTPEVWAEVDALLDKEWKMKNGMRMRILASFIDAGGHFTEDIHRECARRANRRIWPINGSVKAEQYVTPMKKSKYGNATAKFIINPDIGKEAILYASGIEEIGPRYMHFPVEYERGYDMEYFRGLISERQVFRRRGGQDVITWEKTRERNEPLDMRNYARACFKYFKWHFDEIEKLMRGEKIQQPVTKAQVEKRKHKLVLSAGVKV